MRAVVAKTLKTERTFPMMRGILKATVLATMIGLTR